MTSAASRVAGLLSFCAIAALQAAVVGIPVPASPAQAEDFPSPFGEPPTSRPRQKPVEKPVDDRPLLAPMGSDTEQSGQASVGAEPLAGDRAGETNAPGGYLNDGPDAVAVQPIERLDLQPVAAPDGSGLPNELWDGLSVDEVEALLAKLEIPPRSATLHELWKRLIGASAAAPSGGNARFAAMRAEVLYRSGLIAEARDVLAKEPLQADPMLSVIAARLDIAQGQTDSACQSIKAMPAMPAQMPTVLKAEAVLTIGYCSAASGDLSSAGLKAQMAREALGTEPLPASLATADLLDTVAAGAKPTLAKDAKLTALDYRLLQLAKVDMPPEAFPTASPALLAIVAKDSAINPLSRLDAAEAAAAVNAIEPAELAAIYKSVSGQQSGETGAPHRAELFNVAENERTPATKTRAMRALLDDARRSDVYWPVLRMLDKSLLDVQPVAEIGWFQETAIEIALANGRYDLARQWAEAPIGPQGEREGAVSHWLALADLSDPSLQDGRSRNLARIESLAANGRIDGTTLLRLVTVLDALEVQVPIPLWDLSSRTAQPNTGYLPVTGVLSQLQDASKKKQFGRTVLLAMQALGPSGADSANVIALGDSIRALRRAGFEAEARRLGFEALFASWPRSITN